jgi:Arb2 domain
MADTLALVVYDHTGYPSPPGRLQVADALPRSTPAAEVFEKAAAAVNHELSDLQLSNPSANGSVPLPADDVKTLGDMLLSPTGTRVVLHVHRAEGADPAKFNKPAASPIASSVRDAASQTAGTSKKTICGICRSDESEADDLLVDPLGCGHAYCRDCLSRVLEMEFLGKGKSHLDMGCVVPRCPGRFTDEQFRQFSTEDVLEEYEAVLDTIPDDPRAPRLSLPRDFSYDYNDQGQLRHVKTGRKFHWVNQAHYDLLGDQVAPHIQQELMVKELGMSEMSLPSDAWLGENGGVDRVPPHVRNNIFLTPDALDNEDRLMLLIQGSGAVRAGQWARALCINDSLQTGAILGYLAKAKEAGYGVIVFNPNLNSVDSDELATRPTGEELRSPGRPVRRPQDKIKIPGNSDPVQHTIHVWDHVAKQAKAKDIVIVAHSAGGWCTLGLIRERPEILDRLRAIGFTDAVHSVLPRDPPHVKHAITHLAKNWVQSDDPLDTPARGYDAPSGSGCPCVSSGHPKHENTSASAIESVFEFIREKVENASGSASAQTDSMDD